MNILIQLFGISTNTIRLPAFLSGILIIPGSYWLGRRIFSEKAALMTAGLSAGAPLAIEYSAQGRGYTLFWLIFIAVFILATYLKDKPNRFGWCIFVILAALGLLTMPVMLFGLFVIGFWMLISSPRSRKVHLFVELVKAAVSIGILTILLYLPAILRTDSSSLFRGSVDELRKYPSIFSDWTRDLPASIIALLLLGVIVAIVQVRTGRRQGLQLLVAILAAHFVLAIIGLIPPNRVMYYLFSLFVGLRHTD